MKVYKIHIHTHHNPHKDNNIHYLGGIWSNMNFLILHNNYYTYHYCKLQQLNRGNICFEIDPNHNLHMQLFQLVQLRVSYRIMFNLVGDPVQCPSSRTWFRWGHNLYTLSRVRLVRSLYTFLVGAQGHSQCHVILQHNLSISFILVHIQKKILFKII